MNREPQSRSRPRQAGVLAAAAAAGIALLAAACGGSARTAGTGPVGLTAQEVDAYMQCMRSHGMTNFYLSRPGSARESARDTLGLGPYGSCWALTSARRNFSRLTRLASTCFPARRRRR